MEEVDNAVLLKKAVSSPLLVPGLGAGSLGGLPREAGRVGGAHRQSELGYLGKTLAALPCSDKPSLSRPVSQAELHRVGETHPVALF